MHASSVNCLLKLTVVPVAEWVVKLMIEKFAEQLASLQDIYMRECASNLHTLGQRLLFHLDDITLAGHSMARAFYTDSG